MAILNRQYWVLRFFFESLEVVANTLAGCGSINYHGQGAVVPARVAPLAWQQPSAIPQEAPRAFFTLSLSSVLLLYDPCTDESIESICRQSLNPGISQDNPPRRRRGARGLLPRKWYFWRWWLFEQRLRAWSGARDNGMVLAAKFIQPWHLFRVNQARGGRKSEETGDAGRNERTGDENEPIDLGHGQTIPPSSFFNAALAPPSSELSSDPKSNLIQPWNPAGDAS